MKLTEIAEKINAHLKRFEADPEINIDKEPPRGLRRFFHAHAYRAGSRVGVVYISYQGASNLTRDEALKYLAMLDGGYVGRHYEAFRQTSG
jgi:hypothetical protein